ncbi:MAG TPA: hypothetical protein VIH04_07900 [Nitrosarchaeum sp.]
MNLDEFKEQEQVLKDLAIELQLKEKECNELRNEHNALFTYLKNNARRLNIICKDGQFIVS